MKKKLISLLLIAGLLFPGTAVFADDDIPERPYDDTGTLEDVSPATPQQSTSGSSASNTGAADAISVYVAGNQVVFNDQAPVIQNGRTLLPVRAVSEAMNKTVNYNDGIVTISDGNKKMTLIIGKRVVSYVNNGSTSTGTLDVEPVVLNGRTMLPIRAIAEFFGYQVSWNATTRVVDLT